MNKDARCIIYKIIDRSKVVSLVVRIDFQLIRYKLLPDLSNFNFVTNVTLRSCNDQGYSNSKEFDLAVIYQIASSELFPGSFAASKIQYLIHQIHYDAL